MPSCFATGCNSGYNSCGEKHHFFLCPEDSETLQKWRKSILRADKPYARGFRLCDVHFDESDIIKSDTFVIDGKTVVMPRFRWSLRAGAVPTIWPNSSKGSGRKKPPTEQHQSQRCKKKAMLTSTDLPTSSLPEDGSLDVLTPVNNPYMADKGRTCPKDAARDPNRIKSLKKPINPQQSAISSTCELSGAPASILDSAAQLLEEQNLSEAGCLKAPSEVTQTNLPKASSSFPDRVQLSGILASTDNAVVTEQSEDKRMSWEEFQCKISGVELPGPDWAVFTSNLHIVIYNVGIVSECFQIMNQLVIDETMQAKAYYANIKSSLSLMKRSVLPCVTVRSMADLSFMLSSLSSRAKKRQYMNAVRRAGKSKSPPSYNDSAETSKAHETVDASSKASPAEVCRIQIGPSQNNTVVTV